MNALQTAALVAVLSGAAVGCAVHGLRPRRPSIAQVRALLYSPGTGRGPMAATLERRAGIGAVAAFAPLSAGIERRLGSGMRLLSQTVDEIATRIVLAFAAGVVTVVLVVASLAAVGGLAPNPLWLLVALAIGGAFAWILWSDVQQRIGRRRREFQRASNDFVQLIALGLTTDQSVEQAIAFALSVGGDDDDGFDSASSPPSTWSLIEREVATAPQRGIPLWEALDVLGTTYEQRELSELGASIERQGTQGVSITETVSTLAASMRAKALDELEREADKVNANLAGPTVGFVVTMIVFLAYPLALRITEAFGG